jgi:hypothetical protein
MWKLIKDCFNEYIKCQEELNKTGVFFTPYYGIFYFYNPEMEEYIRNKNKDSEDV